MLVLGLLLAVGVGVALGLLGGGGSILTTPILLYVLRVPAHEAIAMSLAVVGATSVAALVPHARAGQVRWRTGALFGASSMVGAYLAGRAAARVPSSVLVLMFGAMMLVTAVALLRPRANAAGTPGTSERTPRARSAWSFVVMGTALGALVGLVGAGGGFLVVPALALFGGLPIRAAVGTSLFVIAINSAAALAGHLARVSIDPVLTASVTAAAVAGSLVGVRLAARVSPDAIRATFGWFVVVMAVFVLGQEVPKLVGIPFALERHWPVLLFAMAAPPSIAAALRVSRARRACAPA